MSESPDRMDANVSRQAAKGPSEQRGWVEARILEPLIATVVDHGFQLHRDIGPGLLESAYESFLAASLREAGHRVECQVPVPVAYRGVTVHDAFRADLLIEGILIVELKSVERLAPVHPKQLLTYLRMTRLPVGLLINFGAELFKDGAHRIRNGRVPYDAP